tara:strand:- start:86 stop:322 length:237 start_codon:yes stop_codon:yes gene_type:complete
MINDKSKKTNESFKNLTECPFAEEMHSLIAETNKRIHAIDRRQFERNAENTLIKKIIFGIFIIIIVIVIWELFLKTLF